jgi:hypothetical protein
MVNFTNVKLINQKHKKIVSTCIFAVQENYLTFKSSLYPMGLLKSVDTFQDRMGKDWIYRIYYDSMYDNYKTNNQYIYDTDTYKASPKNDSYNNVVKSMTHKYSNYVKFLMDWTKHILDKIKSYSYVELIRYDEPRLQNRGYIGHPYTYGSIIRFYGMFDEDVDVYCSVNSSDTISRKIAMEINDWVNNDNRNMLLSDSQLIFSQKSLHGMIDKTLDFLEKEKINKITNYLLKNNDRKLFRINAAQFGLKCYNRKVKLNNKTIDLSHLERLLNKYLEHLISNNPNDFDNNWKYSIDEMILSTILFPMADIFGNNNVAKYVRVMYSGSILSLGTENGWNKEMYNIYKNLNKHNEKNRNNKEIKQLISSLQYDVRINKLIGGKLLEKIYDKKVNNIVVNAKSPSIAWSAHQINIDEYIPVLYFFDIVDKKLTQKLNGILKIKDYVNLTIITNGDSNNSKIISNYKELVIDYSKPKHMQKIINDMTQNLSDYFKTRDFYIDVTYPYNNHKPLYLMNQHKYNKIKSQINKKTKKKNRYTKKKYNKKNSDNKGSNNSKHRRPKNTKAKAKKSK